MATTIIELLRGTATKGTYILQGGELALTRSISPSIWHGSFNDVALDIKSRWQERTMRAQELWEHITTDVAVTDVDTVKIISKWVQETFHFVEDTGAATGTKRRRPAPLSEQRAAWISDLLDSKLCPLIMRQCKARRLELLLARIKNEICPVLSTPLEEGSALCLPCDHIISQRAWEKDPSHKCPLCRATVNCTLIERI